MQFEIRKAVKERAKLRLAFIAPAGVGKTYTALKVGSRLAGSPESLVVIDTEHESAAKYADEFGFDHLPLRDYDPDSYVAAIKYCESRNYGAIVIDGLSHEWAGPGGTLQKVDEIKAKTKSGASHHGWREMTPKHQALIEAMLQSPAHIIATMRSKMTHVVEDGKVRKLGVEAVQREGMEYEFDVVGDMELASDGRTNRMTITKTRCHQLRGKVFDNPGDEFTDILVDWLKGADPSRPAPVTPDQLATIAARMPGWCRAQGTDPDRYKDRAIELWQTFLRNNYGVSTARNLTGVQADDLIGRLPVPPTSAPTVATGAEKEEAKPAPVVAPEPSANGSPLPPQADAAKADPGPVTAGQIDEIKRLMPVWLAVNGPNPPGDQTAQLEAWRGMLGRKYGVVSATRLSESQAGHLLDVLRECHADPTAALFATATSGADQQQQPATTTAA